MGSINQGNGVGSVAGCGDNFKPAAAEIEAVAVGNLGRDLPGTRGIGLRVESLRQGPANLVGGDLRLRVALALPGKRLELSLKRLISEMPAAAREKTRTRKQGRNPLL